MKIYKKKIGRLHIKPEVWFTLYSNGDYEYVCYNDGKILLDTYALKWVTHIKDNPEWVKVKCPYFLKKFIIKRIKWEIREEIKMWKEAS